MGMALGVKNTFGFIRGFAKGRWHIFAPDGTGTSSPPSSSTSSYRFADAYGSRLGSWACAATVRPTVTPLPAVWWRSRGMPSRSMPSSRTASGGMPLPITECASRHGLVPPYEVIDLGLPCRPRSPCPGVRHGLESAPPRQRLLRNVLTKKPKVDQDACRLCGICARVCPADAIRLGERSPLFDYRACIRCYCCQEMCPHAAIRT